MQKEENLVKKNQAANVKDSVNLSSTFDRATRERYEAKKKLICGVDYTRSRKWTAGHLTLLGCQISHIQTSLTILLTNKGPAYKSLESYNNVISGWVKDLRNFKVGNDLIVIKAKVSHHECQTTRSLDNSTLHKALML